MKRNFRFTSESVAEGHPDKLCDQISDAVLDEVLRQDPKGRVACETFVTVGMVMVGGEITTTAWVDLEQLVRRVLREIGYVDSRCGLNADSCAILNVIGRQSPDIAQGVDVGGAGDQGMMIGYACRQTEELMPLPIVLAHRLVERLAEVRKKNILPYLRPDGKAQVTVEYEDGVPRRIDSVVLAAHHDETILNPTGTKITQKARAEIIDVVAKPILPKEYLDHRTKFYVNETGKFVVGGPQSDTGMTGRKIIVDTYGGWARHGGGAFSGKDPTKVDRSAAYMARYIAKNLVAARVCEEVEIRLAYVIGKPDPVDISVDMMGTGRVPETKVQEVVRKIFPLTPKGMIEHLKLRSPIYQPTAVFGHFGRKPRVAKDKLSGKKLEFFTWEKTDKVAEIRAEIGL
ncbi:methionine adenosyltransferase [candidate division WOR-3 bacterium]|nr:methionine adenosyltransferase [candidate division WOR-3 bacterium]